MEPTEPSITRPVRGGTAVAGYAGDGTTPPSVRIVEARADGKPVAIRFDSSEEVMRLVGALLAVADEVLGDPAADVPDLDDIDRADLRSDLDGLGLSFTDDEED